MNCKSKLFHFTWSSYNAVLLKLFFSNSKFPCRLHKGHSLFWTQLGLCTLNFLLSGVHALCLVPLYNCTVIMSSSLCTPILLLTLSHLSPNRSLRDCVQNCTAQLALTSASLTSLLSTNHRTAKIYMLCSDWSIRPIPALRTLFAACWHSPVEWAV